MLFVERPQTDPYFNIAAEEYLFRHLDEEAFMIWRNESSVIIGKHQNAYAEINYPFLQKNRIPVIRRISGGGTVYHDPGNLNFSFISKASSGELISYRRILEPMISILKQLQIPCELEGKSDLKANGFKISGNAEHIYKNKVLHHGTLLFSTRPETIRKALVRDRPVYSGYPVRSNPGETTTIKALLKIPLNLTDFTHRLIKSATEKFTINRTYCLSESDVREIDQLALKKYKTWQWNYGYSPPYSFQNEFIIHDKKIIAEFLVKSGIIQEIHIFDNLHAQELAVLFPRMKGLMHEENTLRDFLETNRTLVNTAGLSTGYLIGKMF